MSDYIFVVTVHTDTYENACKVMAERIDFDEDYGFDYNIDWRD